MAVFRDAGKNFQRGKQRGIKAARQLRFRAFAQHQDILRIAARNESALQTRQQRHQEDRGGNRQRDAQRGHDGEPFSELQIADVITDRYRHRFTLSSARCGQPMWRKPSTIFMRDAP